MELNKAPVEEQEFIKNYYKDNFDIDIEKYSDDELKVILEQLSNSLDKRIEEEQARNQMLKNQLELEKMNIDSLE